MSTFTLPPSLLHKHNSMFSGLVLDRLNQDTMESNSLVLALLRESFYARRQRWTFKFHLSNRLTTPSWIVGTPYQFIYDEAPELLKRGTLVWAYIVQANSNLYYPGPDDHPAHVVFGIDDESNDLDALKYYAEVLCALKRDPTAPVQLRDFTKAISAEQPAFNKKLPSFITDNRKVCFTTTMVHRQYLPTSKLQASWFPLLINPTQTDASIVLPSRYWLPAIKDAWKNYKDWSPQ